MTRNEHYPHLFSEFRLAGKRLKNRIAFASVFTGFGEATRVPQRLIDFHVNRARGGAAMIVTEPLGMYRGGTPPPSQVRVYGQDDLDDFKRWAASVSEHDCHLLAQIQDAGRGDIRPLRKLFAMGSSPLPDDLSWTVPHAMTADEIKCMIDDFVASTRKLQLAGFSGVEISAGHGHIFHQFLSPWMNVRDDEYGGSFENRGRFLHDLIHALRTECGSDFIIGLRLPGCDGIPGSIDWEDSARLCAWFSSTCEISYFNFVQGSQSWALYMHVPDLHQERGPYLAEIKRLRDACHQVPVAAGGRILEPVQAEAALVDGTADFIMMARPLIADAAWGTKASQGRDNDIRKCTSSNDCWGETVLGRPLACDNNPRVGRSDEVDWWPNATSRRRRVVVVGSGIAGLEAAWVAAARGHAVTLFGASSEAGGKIRRYASLPGCETVSSIFDVQLVFGQRAGVNYELSWKAGVDDILALAPDVVVLATGATMMWPPQLPGELRSEGLILDLWDMVSAVQDHPARQPGTAVIYDFDGSDVTYSAAELFAATFERVVIVNPCETIARDEPLVKRQSIYKRMFDNDIELIHWSEPSPNTRFEDGVFVYRNIFTGKEGEIEDVVLFTYSTPRMPNLELLPALTEKGLPVHVIGDAYMPRTIIVAIREGHDIGTGI